MRSGLLALVMVVAATGCGLEVPPNTDRDNDLRRDSDDNCMEIANPDQSDFDGDTVGDACDVCDAGDVSEDTDNDGIPDGCDGCVDNGVDDDMDLIPDNCDSNVCLETGVDLDADEIDDGCDDCVAIDASADTDADGVPDACDPCNSGPQHDEDSDGVFDGCDVCAVVPNPDQANTAEDATTPTGPQGETDATGDACDKDHQYNREIFDAFIGPNYLWNQRGAGWYLGTDQLLYAGVSGGGDVPSYRFLDAVNGRSTIKTRVVFGTLAASRTVGLIAVTNVAEPDTFMIACEIIEDSTGFAATPALRLTIQEDRASLPVETMAKDPAGIGTDVVLELSINSFDGLVSCSANTAIISASIQPANKVHRPGFIVRGDVGFSAAFDYFDAITN